MTTEEAIHRAALRKHRHKGNYEHVHLALAEELQRTPLRAPVEVVFVPDPFCPWVPQSKRRPLWQIIKGWFA